MILYAFDVALPIKMSPNSRDIPSLIQCPVYSLKVSINSVPTMPL